MSEQVQVSEGQEGTRRRRSVPVPSNTHVSRRHLMAVEESKSSSRDPQSKDAGSPSQLPDNLGLWVAVLAGAAALLAVGVLISRKNRASVGVAML